MSSLARFMYMARCKLVVLPREKSEVDKYNEIEFWNDFLLSLLWCCFSCVRVLSLGGVQSTVYLYCLPGTVGNVLSQVFKVVVPCGEFVRDYIELIVIMYEEASFGPEKHN